MGVLLLIFLFIASNGQSISQQQIDVNNLMNNNMDLVDSLLDSAIVQFVKVIETYSNKYQPFGLKLTNFIHINAKKQLPGGADLISKVRTDISNVAPVVNFFHVYNSVEILRITTRKNIFQAYKKVIATELLGNETAGPPCLAQLLYILTYKAILVTSSIKSHLSFTLNILQPQIETLNNDFDSYQASIISQVTGLCKSDQKCAIKHIASKYPSIASKIKAMRASARTIFLNAVDVDYKGILDSFLEVKVAEVTMFQFGLATCITPPSVS